FLVQREWVNNLVGSIFLWLWVQNQLRLHSGCNVVIEVLITDEVQLGGDGPVARVLNAQVQVRWAPWVASVGVDEPASWAIVRNAVRSRLQGLDVVVALFIGHDGAAQVPLRNIWRELGVVALLIRVPKLNGSAAETVAVDVGDLASEVECLRFTILLAHWHLAFSWQLGSVLDIVRALNGTLGAGVALAVVVSLFHDVLIEDIEPQWPLAVFADLNHPPLHNFVLVVGDLVLQGDFFKSLEEILVDGCCALRGSIRMRGTRIFKFICRSGTGCLCCCCL